MDNVKFSGYQECTETVFHNVWSPYYQYTRRFLSESGLYLIKDFESAVPNTRISPWQIIQKFTFQNNHPNLFFYFMWVPTAFCYPLARLVFSYKWCEIQIQVSKEQHHPCRNFTVPICGENAQYFPSSIHWQIHEIIKLEPQYFICWVPTPGTNKIQNIQAVSNLEHGEKNGKSKNEIIQLKNVWRECLMSHFSFASCIISRCYAL